MSLTVGKLTVPLAQAMKPLAGQSPAVAVGTYPTGTPLSLTRVLGRRFTLVGKKANGTDNAGAAYIGTTSARPVLLDVGDAGAINLISPDDSEVNLADYYMAGTDGDGVAWLRAA